MSVFAIANRHLSVGILDYAVVPDITQKGLGETVIGYGPSASPAVVPFRPNALWAQYNPSPEEQVERYLKLAESYAQELSASPAFSPEWHSLAARLWASLANARNVSQVTEKPYLFDTNKARLIALPVYTTLINEVERLADVSTRPANLLTALNNLIHASEHLSHAKTFTDHIGPIDPVRTSTCVQKVIDTLLRLAERFAVEGDPSMVQYTLGRAALIAVEFDSPFNHKYGETLIRFAEDNQGFW